MGEGGLTEGVRFYLTTTKWQFVVDHDAAEEVLADKGQCENGFCQRADTMAVMFAHPAPMHEGGNFETAKEIMRVFRILCQLTKS